MMQDFHRSFPHFIFVFRRIFTAFFDQRQFNFDPKIRLRMTNRTYMEQLQLPHEVFLARIAQIALGISCLHYACRQSISFFPGDYPILRSSRTCDFRTLFRVSHIHASFLRLYVN